MLANMIGSSGGGMGGGCNFLYPAGLNGEPITLNNLNSNQYTVPLGKILHITSLYNNSLNKGFYINGIQIQNGYNNAEPVSDSRSDNLILKAGDVLSADANISTDMSVNGFLVNGTVDAVTITDIETNPFTVPNGKIMVLNSIYNPMQSDHIMINGIEITKGYSNHANSKSPPGPWFLKAGDVLSNCCTQPISVNGYLVDENYFAGCGGGGGSSSSVSNATIDSLSQVVSNLDSLMGIITPFFGCTDNTACNYSATAIIDNGSCSGLLGCMDTVAANYNSSATCNDGSCLENIGYTYQGGIIFYVFQPADAGYVSGEVHGLISAPSDQSTGAEWGCAGTTISGADGMAIGTGSQNTIDIEAGCTTSGTAADICANLTLGGYSDWFLPSRDELNKMSENIGVIDALGLGNFGGFANSFYWSSTEYTISTDAWGQNLGFDVGFTYYTGSKTNALSVRAIRQF